MAIPDFSFVSEGNTIQFRTEDFISQMRPCSQRRQKEAFITSDIPKITSPVDLFYAQANGYTAKIDTVQGGQPKTAIVDSGVLVSRLAQAILSKFDLYLVYNVLIRSI